LLSIFLKNILYKKIFTTNFVRNIYELYNFIGNNYPRRNICHLRFLEKITRKSFILQICLTNLQEKSRIIYNMKIFISNSFII